MKAALFYRAYEPLAIEDVAIPKIEENDILVAVKTCSLCHSDVQFIDHGLAPGKTPPLILGHEVSGKIAKIGSNVKNFKVGDRVLIPSSTSCGKCLACKSWNETQCENFQLLGNDFDGGLAEYIKVNSNLPIQLPYEYSYELGSLISNDLVGAYHVVFDRVNIHEGETVVIFGSGAYGLSILQMAKMKKAKVFMVDIFDWKLKIAMKYGADGVLNSNKANVCEEALIEVVHGKADVIIDTIGVTRTLTQAMNSLKKGGKLVMSGFSENSVPFLVKRLILNEISLIGTIGAPKRKVFNIMQYIQDDRIQWKEMITSRLPLDKINEGIGLLRMQRAIKTMIYPHGLDEANN